MNKRETIHLLVDKLLDLEEQTGKCAFFYYAGHIEALQFHIAESKQNYSHWLSSSYWQNLEADLIHPDPTKAVEEIERLKNLTPDEYPPKEEAV